MLEYRLVKVCVEAGGPGLPIVQTVLALQLISVECALELGRINHTVNESKYAMLSEM